MATKKVVPTLSDRGFLVNAPEKLDQLLALFFTTDAQQTYLYPGQMYNIQALMQKYGSDIPNFVQEIRAQLEKIMSLNFDSAVVQVRSNVDEVDTVGVSITVGINVVQDGVQYSIQQVLQQVNSKFTRIANYVNTGSFLPLD